MAEGEIFKYVVDLVILATLFCSPGIAGLVIRRFCRHRLPRLCLLLSFALNAVYVAVFFVLELAQAQVCTSSWKAGEYDCAPYTNLLYQVPAAMFLLFLLFLPLVALAVMLSASGELLARHRTTQEVARN